MEDDMKETEDEEQGSSTTQNKRDLREILEEKADLAFNWGRTMEDHTREEPQVRKSFENHLPLQSLNFQEPEIQEPVKTPHRNHRSHYKPHSQKKQVRY